MLRVLGVVGNVYDDNSVRRSLIVDHMGLVRQSPVAWTQIFLGPAEERVLRKQLKRFVNPAQVASCPRKAETDN